MRKYLPILLLLFILGSCKDKKVDLSGDTPVKMNDFLAVFPKITSTFLVADTNITKLADTVTIGYKALLQFFPDSSLAPVIGNNKKVTIHPIGMIEKDKESYLLLNVSTAKRITHFMVFVIDKKNKYLAAREMLATNKEDDYIHSVSINREPTFLVSKEKMGKDNAIQFSRTGWVYSRSAGVFMIVVNDSNEDPKKAVVINPIDTLQRKNKFSGDYVQDKKNYISIRDSKKPNVYQFFIHFEKNEGTCIGELKGEFKMKDASSAVFSENGDPCVIDFTFEGNEIFVKEKGTCGNHRGIKCTFNDAFVKKRERIKKK